MIDSCQNIDDMTDEEFIAYLISMGWAEPFVDEDGKVRCAVEEPTAPTREEVERICEDMVAEGVLKRRINERGEVTYKSVKFVN